MKRMWILGGAAAICLGGVVPARAQAVDATATATYGEIELSSGFANDPYRVTVTSGGSIDASTISSGCTGMVSRAPDFEVTFDAGSLPLTFGVDASVDTTLIINGPDGAWTCDDDSGGGTDPEVTYARPRSGTYDVWVGAFGGDSGSAELFVTELGSNGGGSASAGEGYPDSSATAAYGEIRLSAGFKNDPYSVSVLAGGSLNASVVDDDCAGTIASAPDFQLTYEAGSLPLTLRATSNGDVTLVVNGPDGEWHCDDDSGGDSDAELTFQRPASGVYDVWVGSYDGDSLPAELSFSELR
jgi:hypothetical protein